MSSIDLLSIIPIAFGLSADCFAIAICIGLSKSRLPHLKQLHVPLSFGVFQAAMTLIGWLLGRTVVSLISEYDHWLAFGLLAIVGGRMIWESLRQDNCSHREVDISRGLALLVLSMATSIDALAVGLSFAFVDQNITLASSTIGIVAFLVTLVGLAIGKKVNEMVGRRAEVIGGIILIAIGLRILLEHIL